MSPLFTQTFTYLKLISFALWWNHCSFIIFQFCVNICHSPPMSAIYCQLAAVIYVLPVGTFPPASWQSISLIFKVYNLPIGSFRLILDCQPTELPVEADVSSWIVCQSMSCHLPSLTTAGWQHIGCQLADANPPPRASLIISLFPFLFVTILMAWSTKATCNASL